MAEKHGGNFRAFYTASDDQISLPEAQHGAHASILLYVFSHIVSNEQLKIRGVSIQKKRFSEQIEKILLLVKTRSGKAFRLVNSFRARAQNSRLKKSKNGKMGKNENLKKIFENSKKWRKCSGWFHDYLYTRHFSHYWLHILGLQKSDFHESNHF